MRLCGHSVRKYYTLVDNDNLLPQVVIYTPLREYNGAFIDTHLLSDS